MEVKLPLYAKLTLVLLGIVLTVFVMIEAKSVLVPLLISGLLAVLVSPLTGWFERKRIPKAIAAILSLLVLLILLSGLIYVIYNQLISFGSDLGAIEQRVGQLIEQVNGFVEKHIEGLVPISIDSLKDNFFQYLSDNISSITQGAINTASSLTILFILPIYIFLFLYFRHFLIEFLMMAFADKHRDKVKNATEKIKKVVQNYIVGMFIVILILATLNTIALLLLGIRHALMFALFAAMLNVIPYVGPLIGSTLPILFALLTKDSLWYPVGVFLSFYIIQQAEGNFFTPKIVGGRVSMNPFMTIVALFVGNFIWGFTGMILFIPGMAVLKVIFDEIPGMEPYGFLLGDTRAAKDRKDKRSMKDRISRVKGRFKV
ncbi:MAG: AI-2E family transporter [Bacteroides sp.]|jgi:predicted PurR-regulated permease PerM|nr:AI-2E family transporter [Bacteroides sp.]